MLMKSELRQGFLTIQGGHRVGVAGKILMEEGKVRSIRYISFLNIRLAHQVEGCADKVMPFIVENGEVCHTLIISPPCCGKTTLLRDVIRQISNGNAWCEGKNVGVVDERSEIGGACRAFHRNDLSTDGSAGLLSESRRHDDADQIHVTGSGGSR